MEKNCVPATYEGWDTLPLKECTYSVKGNYDPVKKTVEVIMLNAEPDQLARWVVSTCIEVMGNAGNKCTKAMGAQIIGQSGAQFPVAGIVFEDLLPLDGKYEVFAFRNGVTVKIDGVTHRGTAQPSADEIERSLRGKRLELFTWMSIALLKQCSICFCPGDHHLVPIVGGTRSVTGNAWNEVSRDLYKAAWGQGGTDCAPSTGSDCVEAQRPKPTG